MKNVQNRGAGMKTKVTIEEVNAYIKNIISKKDTLNADDTGVDKEILAWISVFESGSIVYKKIAENTLKGIYVNAGLIRNKRCFKK